MRLLIHVGARAQRGQDNNTMAIYYYRWVQNYQIMGILPTLSPLPKSAIIGAVTVDKWVTDSESEWAHPSSEHWLIKDAKLFKQPILGVKGKLGIFDYPAITEDNLPECVEPITAWYSVLQTSPLLCRPTLPQGSAKLATVEQGGGEE